MQKQPTPKRKPRRIEEYHFHDDKTLVMEDALQRMTPENRMLVEAYLDSLNVKESTRCHKVMALSAWTRFLPDFTAIDAMAVKTAVKAIRQAKNQRGTPYKQNALNSLFRDMRQFVMFLANVKKRIHWHLLRKSRATEMARQGYDDRAVRLALWGSLSTQMQSVYVQLSGRDTINEMKRQRGVPVQQIVEPVKPRIVKCIRCGMENPLGAESCIRCGRSLTNSTAPSQEECQRQQILNMFNDPEVLRIIKSKIGGLDDVPVGVGEGVRVLPQGVLARKIVPPGTTITTQEEAAAYMAMAEK